MPNPIIEAVSALAVITAVAVAAIIVPTPRFKPVDHDAQAEKASETTPGSTVVPVVEEKATAPERVLVLEQELQAAKSDVEELKKVILETAKARESENGTRR